MHLKSLAHGDFMRILYIANAFQNKHAMKSMPNFYDQRLHLKLQKIDIKNKHFDIYYLYAILFSFFE